MRSVVASLTVLTITFQLPGAVRGDRAAYVGGTASLKEGTQDKLDVSRPAELIFNAEGSTLKIPYQSVTSLEFGQKIGRRVGATIALGVTTLGLGALPVLFSKKKRHYLTVGYTDSAGSQAAVFELAKDTVRKTLATLEARTGKEVERDDTADQDKPKETTERTRQAAPPVATTTPAAPMQTAPAAASNQRVTRSDSSPSARPIMTNMDVTKMVQAGISHDIVLAAIKNCEPHFTLIPAHMDALLKAGVTDQIVKAMAARQNGR